MRFENPGNAIYWMSKIFRKLKEHWTLKGIALLSIVLAVLFHSQHKQLPIAEQNSCSQLPFGERFSSLAYQTCEDQALTESFIALSILFMYILPWLLGTLSRMTLAMSAYFGNDGATYELSLSFWDEEYDTGQNQLWIDQFSDKPDFRSHKATPGRNTTVTGTFKALLVALLASVQAYYRKRRQSKAALYLSTINRSSPHWPSARNLLGRLHQTDSKSAIEYFTEAADAGHRMSALELAVLIIEQDPDQAKIRIEWGLSDNQSIEASTEHSRELKEKANLALAWLHFTGTPGERRNPNASMELVRRLLNIDRDERTDDQHSTSWFARQFIEPASIHAGANVLRSLIETEERAELVRSQREQSRAELYSFITHSIPSAMSTVVAETEESLEIVQGDMIANAQVRDHLIRSLSSALGRAGFIDKLMATHKLLIAGKDSLQKAWIAEDCDLEDPLIVVVDSIKQAIAQTLFTDREYEQLDIDRTDDKRINQMREVSLPHLTSATTTESVEHFLRFAASELPFLSVKCDPDLKWRVRRGGTRFSVLLSMLSELTRNALRYREVRSPLNVRIGRIEGRICVTLTNKIAKSGLQRLRGTNRGLRFIQEFTEAIGALEQSSLSSESTYTATIFVNDGSNQ